MRDLRSVLHQGMVGMSAAQGIYKILDANTGSRQRDRGATRGRLSPERQPSRTSRFKYPGTRRMVHQGLSFAVATRRADRPGRYVGRWQILDRPFAACVSMIRDRQHQIGGRDLRDLTFAHIRAHDCRRQPGHLPVPRHDRRQSPHGERPRRARPISKTAAKAANIRDFITSLPQGYDSLIGEKGIKLSGGQRQRIAIARALLRDAPILVLDEALSAVDAENEADHPGGARPADARPHHSDPCPPFSSVIGCDRILVLDQGNVAEEGHHEDLLRRGGIYAHADGRAGAVNRAASRLRLDLPSARNEEATAEGSTPVNLVTEGILKAEGLSWYQVVATLMGVILPWKGRLDAHLPLRRIARAGLHRHRCAVGTRRRRHSRTATDYSNLALGACRAGPAFQRVLHWLESWICP